MKAITILLLAVPLWLAGCTYGESYTERRAEVYTLEPDPGPAPWIPSRGYTERVEYYYYPTYEVYQNAYTNDWYWRDGARWHHGKRLPRHYSNLGGRVRLDLDGRYPYRYHNHITRTYPRHRPDYPWGRNYDRNRWDNDRDRDRDNRWRRDRNDRDRGDRDRDRWNRDNDRDRDRGRTSWDDRTPRTVDPGNRWDRDDDLRRRIDRNNRATPDRGQTRPGGQRDISRDRTPQQRSTIDRRGAAARTTPRQGVHPRTGITRGATVQPGGANTPNAGSPRTGTRD